MTTRVLVLGGSGFVGRALLERFERAGLQATVPTRRLANARQIWPLPCVHVVEADVLDPAVLARLLAGHDAVVNLVGILHGNAARFDRVHVQLPRQLAAACAAAGVRRIVHVSALGAAANAPSRYLRSRAAGEQALQDAAQAEQLQLTVLRPSLIFGAGDGGLTLFARLQRALPVIPLARADARFQPVWVRDVAAAIVQCLRDDATAGQVFELCGPDVWILRDLVRAAGGWAGICGGRGRPVIGLPGFFGWLQALFMECLPGKPLLTRDNLASMELDNVASGDLPGLRALGIQPASLAAVGPVYLGSANLPARLDALRRAARR